MMKKFFVLFLFLFFSSQGLAVTILDLNVAYEYPYGSVFAANGQLSEDLDITCSFWFSSVESNALIYRLSDEPLTNAYFSTSYFKVGSPLVRDTNYFFFVACGDAVTSREIRIIQRDAIDEAAAQEFKYVFGRENIDAVMVLGLILGFIVVVGFIVWAIVRGLWR